MAWPDLVGGMDGACLDILGVPVQYTPAAGAATEVTGVFDKAYRRVDAGQAGVSSAGPAVFFRLADLPADPDDDDPDVVVDGTTYRVTEVQKDGQGGVVLLLHETA